MALLTALSVTLLISAFGLVLVMTTRTEALIAAHFRAAAEAAHAADAGVARTVEDLFTIENWQPLLAGAVQSRFVDGAPSGARTLRDGTVVDLQRVANLANCGQATACSDAAMDASTPERPWGANNPRWQPYAYGTLATLIGTGTIASPFYVVVLVGDDGAENDGDPLQDGGEPPDETAANPGAGIVALRSEAFGPRGAHAAVEVTVARTPDGLQLRSWRAVGRQ